MTQDETTPAALLRLPAVMAITGLSRSSLYSAQRAGTFPQSRQLTRRCVAWSSAEVQAWIASRDLTKH